MNTDQIAAEAWQKMKAMAWDTSISDDKFIAIIRTAIEKATEQALIERDAAFVQLDALRAAHASSPNYDSAAHIRGKSAQGERRKDTAA